MISVVAGGAAPLPASSQSPVPAAPGTSASWTHVTISKMPSPPLKFMNPLAVALTVGATLPDGRVACTTVGAVAGPDQAAQRRPQVRRRQSLNSART
jgi:hypothetical protein